jgi:hypothetical protein
MCKGVEWIELAQDNPVVCFRVQCNEPTVSVTGGELLDQLNDYKLFKNNSAISVIGR